MTGENKVSSSDELIALTDDYCNGTLGDDDFVRLEQVLLQEAAARAYFRRYLGMDAALREHGESAAVHWSPALKGLPALGALRGERSSDSDESEAHVNSGTTVPRPGSIGRPWRWDRRVQLAGIAGIVVLSGVAVLLVVFNQREASATAIGTLEHVTGDVRILGANGEVHAIEVDAPLSQGDTVRTHGSESSTVVAYPDGTRLTLVGNTSVTWGDRRSKSIVIHQGTLAASVKPQAAEKPLLLATPSAQLQVLGTRFQIEALENRTELSVTEGRVRLVRIRDQESVEVPDGKCATVMEQNELLVKDIPGLPADWEEDFEAGLPDGWDHGGWVTEGLPAGSRGAVKATWGAGNAGDNYSIRSNAPWLQGLFAVQKHSHLHFTFKTESREWINIFIVTRTAGSDTAHYSGNYLLEDFPKKGSGEWETIDIPLAKFKRIHSGAESLMDLVPFKLMFVFDGPDRGLVIDRVWVTPDGPVRGPLDESEPTTPLPQVEREEQR